MDKSFQRLSDDPRIEVLAPSSISRKVGAYSFWASMIDHLEEIDEEMSAIILKSGPTIILSLPHADLAEKIDAGASPIDLKEHCKNTVPGSKMEDGVVFAGISPDTGKAMYAAPADEKTKLNFNKAQEHVKEFSKKSEKDYRVPTANELTILFNNRAAIGGFKLSDTDSCYWSSSSYSDTNAEYMRFNNGCKSNGAKNYAFSIRLVRS